MSRRQQRPVFLKRVQSVRPLGFSAMRRTSDFATERVRDHGKVHPPLMNFARSAGALSPMVRRAIEAETKGCLAKAIEHVGNAQQEATRLPDRSADRAGHDRCVLGMHAHVKAADQYLALHALLAGAADERSTPQPAYASLSKALDCIRAADEEMIALPNAEAEAERHAECVLAAHGYVRQADGCLDKYRSAVADDDNLGDTPPADAEARAARQRARATAAVIAQGLH
jgi:hypothetical protein